MLELKSENIENSAYRAEFLGLLTRLLYSIAWTDKNGHPKELKKIKQILFGEWVNKETARQEFRDHLFLKQQIAHAEEQEVSTENCFSEFQVFYEAHKNLFDVQLCDMILKSCNEVARAYAGANKSELILLLKLELLFKSNKDE